MDNTVKLECYPSLDPPGCMEEACKETAQFRVLYEGRPEILCLCAQHAERYLPEHYNALVREIQRMVTQLLKNSWSRSVLRKEMERRFPHSFDHVWENRVFQEHMSYLRKQDAQRKLCDDPLAELRKATREAKILSTKMHAKKL